MPGSTAPASVDVPALLAELDRLRLENDALRGVVLGVSAPALPPQPASPRSSHSRAGSAAPDELALGASAASAAAAAAGHLAAHEQVAMRAIYDIFDADKKGWIDVRDLAGLHAKLGEPISDEEARLAVDTISRGGSKISFEDFSRYWDGSHPALTKGYYEEGVGADALDLEREKRRGWYRARFKFMRAKIPNALVGRVFVEPEGVMPSLEYRLRFFYDDPQEGKIQISPWHDVPLWNGDVRLRARAARARLVVPPHGRARPPVRPPSPPQGTLNMIVEIPKWTRRKFEIATSEPFNPIKQDVKNAVLREYKWSDMLFNYGALPQTWENPHLVHADTGRVGDNDPIDIVDIGSKQWSCGSIVRVKVLGVLGLIDAGETDWKLIGISVEDPMAALLEDVADVDVHLPGAIDALRTWLRLYKLPVINDFAFDGAVRGREYALSLIKETAAHWHALTSGSDESAAKDGVVKIAASGLRKSASFGALAGLLQTPAMEREHS
jgi:inorganic pyrophosphatase